MKSDENRALQQGHRLKFPFPRTGADVNGLSAVVLGLGLMGERQNCEGSRVRRKGEPSYRLLKRHRGCVCKRETFLFYGREVVCGLHT